MQPLALSTCWNSYRHQDGYAMLKEIRQLGFPAVELGHAIRYSLWPGVIKAWEENLIKIGSLHNFCPVPASVYRPNPNCYEFSDPRLAIRNSARKASEDMVITPECAWPLGVNDHDARSVCKMFHNLTPEQRAQVLRTRKN